MDSILKNLLETWGVDEDSIQRFQNEGIDATLLPHLTQDNLEKLIPQLGPRLRFQIELEKYMTSNVTKGFCNQTAVISEPLSVPLNNETGEYTVVFNKSLNVINNVGSSSVKLQHFPKHSEIYSLEDVLKSTPKGHFILETYKGTNSLSDKNRNALSECIITHELKFDVNKRVTRERIQYLTAEIVKLFPSEHPIVWYNGEGEHEVGKGKLLTKYYSIRRSMIKCGMIEKNAFKGTKRKSSEVPENTAVISSETEDQIQWLKSNIAPWQYVLSSWKVTCEGRISLIQSSDKLVHDYTKNFPCLRQPLGYTLFEQDFETLYPGAKLKLYSHQKKLTKFLSKKLLEISPQYMDSLHRKNEDVKFVKACLNLSKLFPVITSVKKKKSQQWRPSRLEVNQAFVLHIQAPANIRPSLDIRRNKLEKYGLTLQPQCIFIGATEEYIEQYYIIVDDISYEVESPVKAIDVVFKIYHALGAQYPTEAEQLWLFLQLGVYEISTKWDRKFSSVQGLVAEYQRFKE